MIMKIGEDKYVRVYTDGATVGHNGKLGTVKEVGLGIVIEEINRTKVYEKTDGISNNEAEFKALIKGMKLCIRKGIKRAVFHCDSQIIINRANGRRPIKSKFQNERMDKFQEEVLSLAQEFDYCEFKWIPREENILADNLSKEACRYAN